MRKGNKNQNKSIAQMTLAYLIISAIILAAVIICAYGIIYSGMAERESYARLDSTPTSS